MKNQNYPNLPVVLTSLLMLALPRSGWAQFNFITNADNTITITGYTGPGGNVIIPGTINNYSVTTIGDNAFMNQTTLTSVTIPDSVTSIGDWAFANCTALTGVTIPDSVTSVGTNAFGHSGLMSVTIPNSVTNIGEAPFAYCAALTNIDVAATNPNYASTNGVLFNKATTTLIQCPADLAGSYAIPDSVTSIGGHAFDGCSGLTSVRIPASVTSIGDYAFLFCSGLTSVTIPGSVTSVGPDAFGACTGLHEAFFQGNAPSVNGGPGSADTTVFSGETGTVYYVSGTTGWGAAFGGWPTAIWSSPATDFTYINNNGAITITGYTGPGGNVTIPGTINTYPVTAIGTNAFAGQTTLTGVAIPDSVISIGMEAFDGCSGLTNVTIPEGVTLIGASAFSSCSGLTGVAIPGSVTSIDELAFIGCSGLTNVTIGDGVTSIGMEAFQACGLTSVTIPGSVANIGSAGGPFVGGGPFAACSGLTNIEVDATNSSYASVGGVLFSKALTTLIQYPAGLAGSYAIPDSVTTIGMEAFDGCSGLTSVTIPEGVTLIGASAFSSCSGLTSVMIPGSVTSIGPYEFTECTNLHEAFFQGNAPLVGGLFAGSTDTTVFDGLTGTVYYVSGTTGWGATFGGWPTAGWYQPEPQILGSGYGLGVGSQGFQFTISWATNAAVVVEASTNLQTWTPVSTNTLVNGTNLFWDSDWTHYPQRFYRVGVEQ